MGSIRLPKSINAALAAAAPVYIGGGADADSIVLKPGSSLDINEYGVDVLLRSYSLRTSLARTVRSKLTRGIPDDIYPDMRLSKFQIVDGEGMMSELRCSFKGNLEWRQESVQDDGRLLQTAAFNMYGSGDTSDGVLNVTYYAPFTVHKWSQNKRALDARTTVNGALDLNNDIYRIEGDLRGTGLSAAAVEAIITQIKALPSKVIISNEHVDESVPGILFECTNTAMRVIDQSTVLVVTG